MMETDTSPKCLCPKGTTSIKPISKPVFGSRRLYKCEHCGLAQLFPLPVDEDKIDELYQSDAYLGNISPEEYKGYFTFIHDLLRQKINLNKDQQILDFGAGKCYYHKFFQEAGYRNVHSLEINRHFVAFARSDLGLDNVHLDSRELAPESFDLVFSNQVFEHLVDPMEILRTTILPLVKPGGHVVFAVPNWASWNRPILGKRWVGYSPEDHIWFFSPKSVTSVLQDVPRVKILDITVGSCIGKPYSRFAPSGLVKKAYLKLVWTPIENMSKGDQMVVSLRKTGT